MSTDLPKVFGICAIAMGALYCFFGYRFFKIALGVIGLVIGSILARHAALTYLEGQTTLAMVVGIVGGLVLSFLFIWVYFVGIFVLGACFGTLVGYVSSSAADETSKWILIIILAVIGGALALLLRKHITIIATSFGGGLSIVSGTWYLAKGVEPATLLENPGALGREQYAVWGCLMLIAVLGMLVQYRITGKKTPSNAEE